MRDLHDYQNEYKNQPYERFQVYFRKKKISEILSTQKHDVLLEIGCGLDSIYNDINTFRKLYIIEPANLFYTKVVDDLEHSDRKKDIAVIHKTIEECGEEFDGLKFDFILLSSLLHEIQHPQVLLNKVNQFASSNTVVHINVPNAKSFHRLLAVEMGLIKDEFQRSDSNEKFQQHTIFDLTGLIQLVEENGFRVVDRGTYSFKPFTHFQMETMIQANLINEQMLEGFYNMEKYLPEIGSELFVNVVKR